MEALQGQIKKVDVLPMVKYYIEELNLYSIFQKHMPKAPNSKIEPAQVLCTLIFNIISSSKPFYQVEEWAAEYLDGLSEETFNARMYNDDRLARTMDLLYQQDRATMMTELSSNAIRVHKLETEVTRNDSTSITFKGAYENNADQEAVCLAHGFNKDHRPDCKQIVFGLNVTDDGYVPLSYAIFDGNTTDDNTHIPNWDGLRKFLAKEDFLYIADSKLCAEENLKHIDESGGLFITILPRNRKEVKAFYEYLEEHEVDWRFLYKKENSRKQGDFITYQTYEGYGHHSGYRIIWVLSSAKKEQDRKRRERRIEKILQELSDLEPKLNQYHLKTKEQIEQAVEKICKGSISLFNINIVEEKEIKKVQKGRGRPSPNTKYIEKEEIRYRIEYSRNKEAISRKARLNGIFPLITNTDFEGRYVLQKYKEQPYLEKRMHTMKSVLEVAPVFLKLSRRIEAMMFLYFVALMIVSLIERRIRKSLNEEKIEKLSILPQGMNTKKPTWNNIKYFFRNVHLMLIKRDGRIIQSTAKGMTDLHYLVVDLLRVPKKRYHNLRDGWWEFSVE